MSITQKMMNLQDFTLMLKRSNIFTVSPNSRLLILKAHIPIVEKHRAIQEKANCIRLPGQVLNAEHCNHYMIKTWQL